MAALWPAESVVELMRLKMLSNKGWLEPESCINDCCGIFGWGKWEEVGWRGKSGAVDPLPIDRLESNQRAILTEWKQIVNEKTANLNGTSYGRWTKADIDITAWIGLSIQKTGIWWIHRWGWQWTNRRLPLMMILLSTKLIQCIRWATGQLLMGWCRRWLLWMWSLHRITIHTIRTDYFAFGSFRIHRRTILNSIETLSDRTANRYTISNRWLNTTE